jgi:hypothetical protein
VLELGKGVEYHQHPGLVGGEIQCFGELAGYRRDRNRRRLIGPFGDAFADEVRYDEPVWPLHVANKIVELPSQEADPTELPVTFPGEKFSKRLIPAFGSVFFSRSTKDVSGNASDPLVSGNRNRRHGHLEARRQGFHEFQ